MYGFKDKWAIRDKIKAILNWSCMNSVKENQKYFLHNAKLAAIHLDNIKNTKKAQQNFADTTLKGMYSRELDYNTVAEMSEKMLMKFKQGEKQFKKLKGIEEVFEKYGKKIKVKSQSFDSVCER